ncbi:MAG: hypothetical protein AAF554_15850 [Bacteroidota bacterium]
MNRFSFLLLVLLSFGISAQQSPAETPPPERLTLDTFSYPDFFAGERHAMFALNYKISDTFHTELQTFYDTYLTSNRTRTGLRFKKYLSPKFYIYSGSEIEIVQDKLGSPGCGTPRTGILGGMGYQLKENFFVEAGFNSAINVSTNGTLGESELAMPVISTVTSRIRF